MTAINEDLIEDDFSSLLAKLDRALAVGDVVDTRKIAEDPAMQSRLSEAQACLELLRSVWPDREENAAAIPERSTQAPHQIGRFEIEQELGRGGHGVVFLAFDPLLRRRVALKVPRPENLSSQSMRDRFQREAQLAARLDHPNLVAIHEVDVFGPIAYLVTAYCPGPSLAQWLKLQSTLPSPVQATRILLPLVEAVEFMHSHGVLHRDIKPGNILLDNSDVSATQDIPGVPKLTDFGLAIFVDANTRHTHSGALVGTLAYMPPEQVDSRRESIGPQQDVYSIGVVLYECLTGKPPFQGVTEADTIRQLLTDEPIPPRHLRQAIPRDLEVICLKCLQKDPRRRYVTAADFANDLRSFLNGEAIRARPISRFENLCKLARRHPTITGLSIVTAIMLLCVVGIAIWYTSALERQSGKLRTALNRAETSESQLAAENYAFQIKFAEPMQAARARRELRGVLESMSPHSAQVDHRGFEWHYLMNVANQECRLRGHRRPVYAVAVSPDGKLCASGSKDGLVLLWDLVSRLEIARWNAAEVAIQSIDFSQDGSLLWIAADDKNERRSLAAWDVASRCKIVELPKVAGLHTASVFASLDHDVVGFIEHNDSKSVYFLGLWNWRTGELRNLETPQKAQMSSASFSPDGRSLVASCFSPYETLVWELPSGRRLPSITGHAWNVNDAAWSRDGRLLATCSSDETVKLWDVAENKLHLTYTGLGGRVRRIAFHPNGSLIAICRYSADNGPAPDIVALYDTSTGARSEQEFATDLMIHEITWSPTGKTMVIACEDHHVYLWNPFVPEPISTLKVDGKKEAWAVAFSPDSKTLAVGYDDEAGMDRESLRLWNVDSGEGGPWLRGHQAMVTGVAFSPAGNRLYSAGYDNTIKIWNIETNELIGDLGKHDEPVKCLAISRDGQTVATGGHDKLLKLWDTNSGRPRLTLSGHGDLLHAVAFCPTKNVIASADNTFEIRLWNTQAQQPRLITDLVPFIALAFSPDGHQLAAADQNGFVSLYDTDTATLTKRFYGHHTQASAVAFSPDGKTLATGGNDHLVRLWHLPTSRELLALKDLSAPVIRLTFSPDGQHLAAALSDGSVRIWHARR